MSDGPAAKDASAANEGAGPPAPAEPSAPAQTSAAAETSAPVETSAPAETAAPAESSAPAESASPADTQAPAPSEGDGAEKGPGPVSALPRTNGLMWLGFEPLVPGWWKSPVTLALISTIVAMFAITQAGGNTHDPVYLTTWGALDRGHYWSGEVWRVVTAGFLHYGVTHFFFNTIVMPGWGARVEHELGRTKLLLAFFGAVLAGNAVSVLVTFAVSAGASGGIYGLMGLVLVLELRAAGSLAAFWKRAGVGQRLFAIISGLVLGVVSEDAVALPTDEWAHIGGLVFGMLFGVVVTRPSRARVLALSVGLAVVVGLSPFPQVTPHGRWNLAYDDAVAKQQWTTMVDLLLAPPSDLEKEWVRTQLAWAHLAQGQYFEAVADVDSFLPRDKKASLGFRRLFRAPKETHVDARRMRSHALFYLGRYDEALDDLADALQASPDDPWARYVRALVYRHLDREAEAEKDLDVAISKEQAVEFYELRAWVRLDQRKAADARFDIDQAAALGSAAAEVASLRGWLALQTDDAEGATALFDEALQLDPNLQVATTGRCESSAFDGSGPEAVTEHCTRAIETMPAYERGLELRANAALELDDLDSAEADYLSLQRLRPDHRAARIGLSWTFVRQERAEDARREIAPLLEKEPEDAIGLAIDAEAALLQGDRKTAVARYREALKHAPEDWNFMDRALELTRELSPARRRSP